MPIRCVEGSVEGVEDKKKFDKMEARVEDYPDERPVSPFELLSQ